MAGKALPGAARSDGVMTPITPHLLARVSQGVRYMLTGVRPDTWFGPSQPLQPQAQTQADGRQYDYPTAVNTVWTPKSEGSESQITFHQLRHLADSCDLVRLAIETRKDQMGRLEWTVKPRDEEAESDDRCKQLIDFFALPDREHDWSTWLRILLEDMLVIDAPALYPRLTRGNGVYSLDIMDGSIFKRIITVDGRTPIAPDPAYQAIIKGMPAVDYSRDELLYMPRNPRSYRLYGYSPVEQIIVTVNIALRRQLHKLQYYTEGSAPDLMIGTPPEWNPEQIRIFQEYFDGLLSGNTAERRRARFVPAGLKPFDLKEAALKDDYDEWLARVVCFCFSLPPTAFIKQVNRGTAQNAQDVALEEGLAPLMQWTTNLINQVIWRWFGYTDLCFAWQQDTVVDQLTQAQIDQIYVMNKVVTADEVREELGMEPLTDEQKDELNPMPQPGANGEMPGEDTGYNDRSPGVGKRAYGPLVKKKYRVSRASGQQSPSRARRCVGSSPGT